HRSTLYNRAIGAGAKPQMPMADQFWGDRAGAVSDPAGYTWWIATRKEDLTKTEIQQRPAEFFHQRAKQAPYSGLAEILTAESASARTPPACPVVRRHGSRGGRDRHGAPARAVWRRSHGHHSLWCRLLPRVHAVRAARSRRRADGEGRHQRRAGGRVHLEPLGAAGWGFSVRLDGARARSSSSGRHQSDS